ncbi:hypothetical protein Hypma_000157 [Hypsizygus marmoreus]|uniref:VWFA domain-containing protein n=1 Tax=Hypsizygus marmoreus TaxID=39966 RepID=A0A369KJ61_HYPMA|nr:hypothetical protein Hypma_000157 [Hypsizygus marmoreus]
MASRPSFTSPEQGRIIFTIPPEWFVTISAVSRQTYGQNVLADGDNSRIHYSNNNIGHGLMRESNTGFVSSSIAHFSEPTELDVFFSFTTANRRLTAAQLRSLDFRSLRAIVAEAPRNPSAPAEVPEYTNYFVFVENTAQSGGIHDMLLVVSLHSTNNNEIPPPPPDNVVRPYNPVLDLPWPGILENYLSQYQVHFLVDDSGSMGEKNRWQEASNALIGLSHTIFDRRFVRDGIGLSFLNAAPSLNGITDRDVVANTFRQVSPQGRTPTGQNVSRILNAHIDILDATQGTPAYVALKPLNLIVITDGISTDGPQYELRQMLINIGARLAAVPHHPNSLGVQFVQIGSDATAAIELPKLIQADTGHIVDTVPWLGPGSLSPDRLERILLGGLHPNIRARRATRARLAAATAQGRSFKTDVSPPGSPSLEIEVPPFEVDATLKSGGPPDAEVPVEEGDAI